MATVPVGSTGSTSSSEVLDPMAPQALPDGPPVGVVSHSGHHQRLPAHGGEVGGDVEWRPGDDPTVGELVDQGLAEEQGDGGSRRLRR